MRRLAFLSFAFVISIALHAQSPDAYKSDPKFQKALAEAKQLERTHRYAFAVDAYKKPARSLEAKTSSASTTSIPCSST